MSFPDEYTAFRKYAELYPSACILLVDTYDTLKSGIPNAIRVFTEMRNAGIPLTYYGIRMDSGDLAYRDEAGYVHFAGRLGDWMRVDGENLGTAPIERVLMRYPDEATHDKAREAAMATDLEIPPHILAKDSEQEPPD